MYKRLCAILDFIQTSPEADRAKIQAEAKQLVAKFIRNYTDFFEMMVVSSKLATLETATRNCLLGNKTVVMFIKRTGANFYSRFKNHTAFTNVTMPFSATMYV